MIRPPAARPLYSCTRFECPRRSGHGPASLLEGLPEALPRFLPDRALSGLVELRAGLVQPHQHQDRQPPEAADGRRRDRRAGRQGGHRPRLRIAKGQYLLVEDEELEKIKIESTHTIDIDSFVPRARDRRSLPRQPLLHRADRPGRPGGLRGHPRRDPRQEDGGARPRRAVAARARRDARSVRQGPARDHPALRLRGARPAGLFRGHSGPQAAGRDEEARRPHRGQQGRPLRSDEVRGSLREGARRAAQEQAGRHRGRADRQGRGAAARDQPDGCAARQHRRRRQEAGGGQHPGAPPGRARGRPDADARRPDARRSKASSPSPGGSPR